MVFHALDPDREIYPGATLQVVAMEIGFFDELPEDVLLLQNDIYKAVKETFPLPGPAPREVTFEINGDAPPTPRNSPAGFRFLDRPRTKSVVLTSRNLIFETSAYEKFEGFVEDALGVASAIAEIASIPAIAKIGLRYIDEIPESLLPEPNWSKYLASPLLGILDHFKDESPSEFNFAARFKYEAERQLILRYGLLSDPAVNPNGPLNIPHKTEGQYFLFDINSFWDAPSDDIPAFDRKLVEDTLYALHDPVSKMFEDAITDDLRNDVLRKERQK
jgi:uncharacterized protein (TIGR04255 family)